MAASLSACSSSAPTEELMKEKTNTWFEKRDAEFKETGLYRYSLKKTDEQAQEVNGTKLYVALFSVSKTAATELSELSAKDLLGNPIIKSKDSADVFIKNMSDYNEKFDRYAKNPTVVNTFKVGDTVLSFTKKVIFIKTENGWQLVER